jgi:hypothetical protein
VSQKAKNPLISNATEPRSDARANKSTPPLLDALMYRDLQPFWPITAGNPLLGILGPGMILLACSTAGLLGAVWLLLRWYKASALV